MKYSLRQARVQIIPAPTLMVTRWLLRPFDSIGEEGDAELRQTLVRRLGAILISAAMMSSTALLVAVQHPIPVILVWVGLDLGLSSARLPVILKIIRLGRAPTARHLTPGLVDLFVLVGTLWSAVVGLGTLACVLTSDPGLSMVATALALGTIGAQGVRSPGSPRLNIIQMCLVIVPFTVGLLSSEIPLATWIALLIPFYLVGMIGITLQLHKDYAKLIVSGIENRRRALHCSLTSLPNRAYFHEILEGKLKEVGEGPLIVLYLDLDGFKNVNDTLGHSAGDELLRQVADRLRAWKPPETVVARLGGDEFAAVTGLDACQVEDAVVILLNGLREQYDLGAYGTASIGVSVGLAIAEPDDDIRRVTFQADQALYAAKNSGKGTYRWHSDTLQEARPMASIAPPPTDGARAA